MKAKLLPLLVALNLSAGTLPAADSSTESFQKALFEEEANQNLDAAIKAYQAVVDATDAQRKLAASAVFRLGECYRKLGQTNAAVAQYQRLLRDYTDQTNLVTLSRQNLAGLNATLQTAGPSTLSNGARLEQQRLFQEEIKLAEQQLEIIKRQIEVGRAPKEDSIAKEREILALRRQLAALDVEPIGYSGDATTVGEKDKELRRIQALLQESPDLINAPGKNGETLLQLAAGKGQLDVVQFLLNRGAAVDGIKRSALTPLHFAVGNGHKAVVDLLLHWGAEAGATAEGGITPLHLAALKGYAQVAKALIDAGAPVNARTGGNPVQRDGENLKYYLPPRVSPLDTALAQGYSGVAELLVAAKADLNAPDGQGRPPLFNAVVGGQKSMVELLLERGANVNVRDSKGDAPLHWAAQQGKAELVAVLLAHKADVNIKTSPSPGSARELAGSTPLHLAAVAGQKSTVEALLKNGAEVNARDERGETPLFLAAKNKSADVAAALLTAKADPNLAANEPWQERDWTPLHEVIANRDKETAGLLLDHGANPDARIAYDYPAGYGNTAARKGTPLLMAVSDDQPELAKLLLEHKADPNLASDTGWLPLPLAISKGNPGLAEALLTHHAKVEAPNPEGLPPLVMAVMQPSTNLVTLLLNHGADVNARTRTSGAYTALHSAVYKSREMVELLLAHKADPNIQQANDGATPLHGAVSSGNKDMVELLLAHRADPNIRNRDGDTPLDLTKKARSPALGPIPAPMPPLAPGIPTQPIRTQSPTAGTVVSANELAALLRQHGARDDLPRLDRIEVQRFATGYRDVAFWRGTNDLNRFSLLELVAAQFDLLSTSPSPLRPTRVGSFGAARLQNAPGGPLSFPDFARVVVRHPTVGGKGWEERRIDLAGMFKSGDCAGDVWLDWGDVVEIPEADHPISAPWLGSSGEQLATLKKCLTRHVEITVKSQTTKLDLSLDLSQGQAVPGTEVKRTQFTLMPVLYDSKLLLTSSDLSRVKVTRRDPNTGQERAWVFDCSDRQSPPDFWLRDGDVIEVPEK